MRVALAETEHDSSLDAIWRAYLLSRPSGVESSLTSTMWPRWGLLGTAGDQPSASGECEAGVGQSIYIGQFTDATGLSYLNARYYNSTQGQFTTEDPVFLGNPSQQNLQDPQSLNAYSYSEDNPIIKSDPSGKCLEDGCVVELGLAGTGLALGLGGRYYEDVQENREAGATGLAQYAFRSSPQEYAVAGATGAIGAVTAAYTLAGAALVSAGGYALENNMEGNPFSLTNTLLVGGLSYAAGGFAEWGVGEIPDEDASLLLKKGIVGSTFETASEAVLVSNLSSSAQGYGSSLPEPVISQSGINYYRNSSGLLSSTPQTQQSSGSSGGSYTQTLPANYHTVCGTLCQ